MFNFIEKGNELETLYNYYHKGIGKAIFDGNGKIRKILPQAYEHGTRPAPPNSWTYITIAGTEYAIPTYDSVTQITEEY